MKKLICLVLLLVAAGTVYAQNTVKAGKDITESNAIPATQLAGKMGDKEQMHTKVSGTVESVCQMKGCWMKVNTENGGTMRVMFKDYAFFVPKDITGKTVVFEGEARKKLVSVADLQHYAKDAGKSKEEIAGITKPEEELTFIAEGVIVK
ncbi:DUF4920 domain-containing protein [Dyadobacter sandarakinus]|uniref:DUF4920 domain-containing protein n=1 Tax=Dyadobacter sandarakinus TaxID=2747268 RepID=A0ABX7ICF1_9BACT|nr:DUF4920 domain-containing protein [Dyadobacter sandarakinus]QRR03791.1 DUF4920 domain-containing protein [Dyadobacter sandarakinus]